MGRLPLGLLVSCQTEAGSPFAGVEFIRAFAQAAVRLCGVETIRAVRPYRDVPIIGLTKDRYADGGVLITAGMIQTRWFVQALTAP